MGLRQEKAIGAAIVPILSARNRGWLCCTIETVNAQGQDVTITYTGTIDNGSMKGSVKLGEMGTGTWTAKRQ